MAWEEIGFTSSIVQLSSSAPADIGTTAAAGSGSTGARSDHVHKIGTGAINASTMFASGVVDATALASNAITNAKIASSAVTTAKINIDANLAFNQKQAVGMVLHSASTAPNSGSEVAGQIYYDTVTKTVKIWVP